MPQNWIITKPYEYPEWEALSQDYANHQQHKDVPGVYAQDFISKYKTNRKLRYPTRHIQQYDAF